MAEAADRILKQLALHAPPGTSVPKQLESFVEWHVTDGKGLGFFTIVGDRLDDFYIEDGSRRASAFFSFLRCADGSRVGMWRPNGEPLADASVAFLGGEGDLAVLGVDLADFLTRWSQGTVPVPDLTLESEDEDYAENLAARGRLAAWLDSLRVEGGGTEEELREHTAQLETWFESWSAERLRFAENDESRVAMADCLRDVIGLPSEPWQRNFVDAIVTANQCMLFRTYVGQKPVELSSALESSIRQFRDHDAQELPEAGLWFRAGLELDSDGVLTVKRTYLERPNPDEIQLDENGVREDLERMPRATYWMPPWLS